MTLSVELAQWASRLEFEDLPTDVVEATKFRILDVIGLSLAGSETDFGRSTRDAATALSPAGPCRVFGTGERVGVGAAALANAALAQALEYDDTHNESVVHMSSPSVAAALALAELSTTRKAGIVRKADWKRKVPTANRHSLGRPPVSGRELIAAIALGNEISCRAGSAAPGQFHRLGFHPTGLFAPFGVAYLSSKLLGGDEGAMARAAGICGSFAAGLLECWVDGTQAKFLHSGWASQSGMAAAFLARGGATGPAGVFEGRFGLYASHLQDPATPRALSRITVGLGTQWESRRASFKPYPAAHVIHPYLDALLRLRARHGIRASDVAQIDCPVAAFIVPIVCEPASEKLAPASDSHGRVSLQYSLAEALFLGGLGRNAYGPASLVNPEILALARRVQYAVDPLFPGPAQFKGAVTVTLKDGRRFSEVEEHNRGSVENPMSRAELIAKFNENAGELLSPTARERLVNEVERLDTMPDAARLVDLAVSARPRVRAHPV